MELASRFAGIVQSAACIGRGNQEEFKLGKIVHSQTLAIGLALRYSYAGVSIDYRIVYPLMQ